MDVNEPFGAEASTGLGNHLPSGYDNQYEVNESRRRIIKKNQKR